MDKRKAHSLSGKRTLFIGIGFYDYETAIRRRLEGLGASVSYFLEQPRWHESAVLRRISSIFGMGTDASRDRYQRRLLQRLALTEFDYVFIIKGELLSEYFVCQLRAGNEKAKFILYQWDSIRRIPQVLRLLPYFDRILSFDRRDCQEHKAFVFRPLFYRDATDSEIEPTRAVYDFTFIGWLHSDRFTRLLDVEAALNARGSRVYFYLYTGIGTYLRHLIRGNHRLLHFRKLPFGQVTKIMAASICVLDFPHADQQGLTMRTIEAIGIRRKLITTNSDIVNYDFFDQANILPVQQLNVDDMLSFAQRGSATVPEQVLDRYSLNYWLAEVFELSGDSE
jgi:hypothetical protein